MGKDIKLEEALTYKTELFKKSNHYKGNFEIAASELEKALEGKVVPKGVDLGTLLRKFPYIHPMSKNQAAEHKVESDKQEANAIEESQEKSDKQEANAIEESQEKSDKQEANAIEESQEKSDKQEVNAIEESQEKSDKQEANKTHPAKGEDNSKKLASEVQRYDLFNYKQACEAESAKRMHKLVKSLGLNLPIEAFIEYMPAEIKEPKHGTSEKNIFTSSSLTKDEDMVAVRMAHHGITQAEIDALRTELEQVEYLKKFIKLKELEECHNAFTEEQQKSAKKTDALEEARQKLQEAQKETKGLITDYLKLNSLIDDIAMNSKYIEDLPKQGDGYVKHTKAFFTQERALRVPVLLAALAGLSAAAAALTTAPVVAGVLNSLAVASAAWAASRGYMAYETAKVLEIPMVNLPRSEMPRQSSRIEIAATLLPVTIWVSAPYALTTAIASRVALYTQFSARTLISVVASLYTGYRTRPELAEIRARSCPVKNVEFEEAERSRATNHLKDNDANKDTSNAAESQVDKSVTPSKP